ncbi:NACHT domain-containing protein [Saccharopolyspora shandongensis]|uniref:NACHT domain-containing protein n=1 Tax=Saccharopolyspora shandongensis TaxID=418495 RepID=UPI0033D3FF27
MRWHFRLWRRFSAARRIVLNKFSGSADIVVQAGEIHGDVVFGPRARGLDQAVERLAKAVEAQWRAESQTRSLHRPHPLRLRWSSTGRDVAAATADLRIEGDLGDVVEKFRALPTPQLVVLGEPGAGKTVLALLFALGMLGSREPGEPVPVPLSASSWNPFEEFLDDWIAQRLRQDHPALANRRAHGRNAALRLVEQRRIIPVLDGLDELPHKAHVKAIEGIDRAAAAGRPLVVTCRSDEFQHAVEAGGRTLAAAAVVEVQQVDAGDAIAFLSAGLPRTTAKWRPVFAQLRQQPESPLAAAFATPLMVSLARTAYAHPERDPAELLDPDRFADAAAIEHHLLDAFLPTVYADQPTAPSTADATRPDARPYPAEQAQRWLDFLAHHLADLRTRDIAWWRLRRPNVVAISAWIALLGCVLLLGPGEVVTGFFLGVSLDWLVEGVSGFRREQRIVRTLLTSLPVLLYMFWFSTRNFAEPANILVDGLGFALLLTLLLSTSRSPRRTSLRIRRGLRLFVLRRMVVSFLVAFLVGMSFAVINESVVSSGRTEFEALIGMGVFFGFLGWGAVGVGTWLAVPSGDVGIPHPIDMLRWDRASTFVRLLAPIAVFQGFVLFSIFVVGNSPGWYGFGLALYFGLGFGLGVAAKGAWMSSWTPRLWWALRGRLPWRLMAFLDDGHRRGVFRQVGAVYQFRHARLQDHLANRRRRPAERDFCAELS